MAVLVVADYAVIAVMLIISSGIGVYYWFTGGKQKSTEVSLLISQNQSNNFISVRAGIRFLCRTRAPDRSGDEDTANRGNLV